MKLFLTVALVLLSALVVLCDNSNKLPPTSLQIGVKFMPEECLGKAKNGMKVTVHYTGELFTTGEVFDSSVERDQPFKFILGRGDVIQGWDKGILGMCIGEKRKLIIPSDLAYGSRGAGGKIPPNAALVFHVELLDLNAMEKDDL
ncbi:hypothetical protein MP638_000498 [Amoeboaphelidium occidentale]|nr:hypothetical protein MP638_000498 [Amoeboaphelidium occidentale]